MKKETYIKKQAGWLTAGQIGRRQFIMSALAAGVALPSALSMADKAMAAAPKKGGKFRHGSAYGSTTDALDPGTAENAFTQLVIFGRGNCLTEVSNDGSLIPDIAESFESSDGAKTWAFTLRKGVEFHDGRTMTADDVIATFNYHRGEESKSAAKGLLTAISDIRKDGDKVIFELSGGNADFPVIVSDYHLMILPSKDGAVEDANTMIGTGGFVLNSFEAGVRAAFTRNPNYYKEGRAHFDEIEIISLLDTTARQNAVMNGDVDMIDNVDAIRSAATTSLAP